MDTNNTIPVGQNGGVQLQPTGQTQDPSQSPAEVRRRRKLLTWIIIVGVIDLILLLLLLLLPCKHCEQTPPPIDPDRDDDVERIIEDQGGNINAYMQFTIDWNRDHQDDYSDVDAHALEPDGNEIYFENKCGKLDVDYKVDYHNHKVEHISWNRDEIADGQYVLGIHQYEGTNRGGVRLKFKAGDKVYTSSISRTLHSGDQIVVARVTMRNGEIESLDSEYFR
ncbi:MAG: hypothetical protein IK092_04350 [Muribaculaceae bacterium]|nr:hypothetical protein [Muribaculaceae bacterium]